MRSSLTIKFRGEDQEIEYTDYGHDPTVNSHDVEYGFIELHLNDLELTDEEEQAIYEAILKHANDIRSSQEEDSFYDK